MIQYIYNNSLVQNITEYEGEMNMDKQKESLNSIYCGPPGTGKTYNIANRCLEIIDENKYRDLINNSQKREELIKEFNKLVDEKRIVFSTFHQSYGYEEFVEGIRITDKGSFEIRDGIFKNICSAAMTSKIHKSSNYEFDEEEINFHKMSLGNIYNEGEQIYSYCMEHNVVALGWGLDIDYSQCENKQAIKEKFLSKYPQGESFTVDAVERFKNWIDVGDIIIISHGNTKAKAIARVIGDYYYDENSSIEYNHFRKVEWLVRDAVIPVNQILMEKQFSQQSIYMFYEMDLNMDSIKALISTDPKYQKYILIIDEINRGNVSKVFGELITLIEEDKRIGNENETYVTLPYSNDKFGVPNNVYILATMNTADRSIALMDTALRRRFTFEEVMPNEELLHKIGDIDLQRLLGIMNKRIEFLYDRDHMIGHAYFMNCKSEDDVIEVIERKIIPLLKEYFYEDWEKIGIVLGGIGDKENDNYIIYKEEINPEQLFNMKNISYSYDVKVKYHVKKNIQPQELISIYEK